MDTEREDVELEKKLITVGFIVRVAIIAVIAVAITEFWTNDLPLWSSLLIGVAGIGLVFAANSVYQFFATGRHRGE